MKMCRDMDYMLNGRKIHFGIVTGEWNGLGLENAVFIPAGHYGWMLAAWFVKQGYPLKSVDDGLTRVVELSFLSLQDFYRIDQELKENAANIVSEMSKELAEWKRAGFKTFSREEVV